MMRSRKALRSVVATWAIVALALVVVGAPQAGPAAAKVTEIKLEAFGWHPPVPPHPGEIDSLGSQKLTIDSTGRVLVSFTVRGPNEELMRRSHPGLLLRIVRFGTDGRADLSLALPTDNWLGNGVYLDNHDRIVARADDKLLMPVRSPESGAGQIEWKTLAPCGPHCEVFESLSRRTFYLDTWDADPPVTVLNMDDLSDIRHCQLPRGVRPESFIGIRPNSITDTFAYFNYAPIGTGPVLYRWPLCDLSRRTQLPVVAHFFPVDAISDSLFLSGHDEYGSDGKLMRQISIKLSKHEDVGVGGVEGISANGERLALTATTWKGGLAALDISSHMTAERVIVYDLARSKELASIPIQPMWAILHPAISPDGHRVAALVRATLTIADLP
ncbi:MAG: hypothetical protein ACRD33_05165 [Candidatus Acidiferrales bacterium]